MPLLDILDTNEEIGLAELIASVMDMSRSAAHRLLQQKGVTLWTVEGPVRSQYQWVNKRVLDDPKFKLRCTVDDLFGIKVGKRKYFTISQVIGEVLVVECQQGSQ